MSYIRMYKENIIISWKSRIVYPGAFLLAFFSQLVGYLTQFLTTWILIKSFSFFNGWEPEEVIFIYAMQLMTYALASAFVANTVSDMPDMVRDGTIDQILVKPISPLFYFLSSKFNVGYLSHFTISLIMIIYSLSSIGCSLNAMKIIMLVISILSGAVITGTVMLIATLPCLFFIGSGGWWQIFYDLRSYTNYPISIYNYFVQLFFTCIIPFAFIAFYPAQYLFSKNDGLFHGNISIYLSPVVAVIMLIITRFVWIYSVKKYDGSGS